MMKIGFTKILFGCITFLYLMVVVTEQSAAQKRFEQNFEEYIKFLSPEKLYIQTDRDSYCVGDTIWMKGFLKNASAESGFVESNFIYVELFHNVINQENSGKYKPKQTLALRKKIKRDNGGFVGYLVLPDDLSTGKVIIRGYSYWMMNNSPEYMFTKELAIINPMKDNLKREMVEKGIKKDADFAKYNLSNPFDSADVNRNRDYDLQFMPESGRYLVGVPSRIAYKIVDREGYGAAVNGFLFNSNNQKIGIIKSDKYGFGELSITPNSANEKYYAVLEDEKGFKKRYSFPAPAEEGVTVNVAIDTNRLNVEANKGAILHIKIEKRGRFAAEELTLHIIDKDQILYSQSLAAGESDSYTIAAREFTTGINSILVSDKANNIICKRVICILPYFSPSIELKFNKESYKHRERVIAMLQCKDADGQPIGADLGISVTDPENLDFKSGNNIISEFFLKSELTGYVENPERYFDITLPYSQRMKDVDLLVMTQGWNYYDYNSIAGGKIPAPKYGREYIQTISGRIRGLASTTHKKSMVMFTAPSIHFSAYGEVDSGYFCLKDVDFPEGTKFLVGAVGGKRMQSKLYTPIIDEEIFAPQFDYKFSNKKVGYSYEFAKEAIENYYRTGGERVYNLDPIVITGRFVPKNSPSPFGNVTFAPNEYKSEEDLKSYSSWNVMDYVANNFTALKIDYTDSGKFLVGRGVAVSTEMTIGSRWHRALVYVNKKLIDDFEYDQLFSMPIDNVSALAVCTGMRAAPFQTSATALEYPRAVLLINTKNPYGEKVSPPNVASTQPLGWQKPTRFYSPKYSVQASGLRSDRRKTLYWDPYLYSPKEGIEVSFYNSDITNSFDIVIEGIDSEGNPLYYKASTSEN